MVLLTGTFIGVPLMAPAEILILRPAADTTLFETYPSNNLGRVESLAAGTTARGRRSRALLRFDLAGNLPTNATVFSATLTLSVVRAPSGGGGVNSTFHLHRMVRGWIEGTKNVPANGSVATAGEPTWLSRAHPSTPWSVAGAAAPADFVEESSSSQFVSGLGAYEFSDLADDVQFWQSTPSANFGWILISDDEITQATARRFGARENTNSPPELLIEFTTPRPPAPRITQAERLTNAIRLRFLAIPNAAYTVEHRPFVRSGAWAILTNIEAQPTPREISIFDAWSPSNRFYRLLAR